MKRLKFMKLNNVEEIPIVSVHMISYKHERFIAQAIEGVLMQQTDFPIELIISDDCSPDGTMDIILEYAAKYPTIVKPIIRERNLGSMRNFSDTFKYCKGKYVALCESDDYWTDPHKLQKQIDFLEQNPDFTLCFHNALITYDTLRKPHLFSILESREYSGGEILQKWSIPTASVVFKNALLNPEIFFEDNYFYGDMIIFLKMAQSGKLWCLNETMSIYRRHSGGISFGSNNIDKILKYIEHNMAIANNFSGLFKKEAFNIVGQNFALLSIKYFLSGKIREGISASFQSIKYSPLSIFSFIRFKIKNRNLK